MVRAMLATILVVVAAVVLLAGCVEKRGAATCCRVCASGCACGDTCIDCSKTCRQSKGCACNARR